MILKFLTAAKITDQPVAFTAEHNKIVIGRVIRRNNDKCQIVEFAALRPSFGQQLKQIYSLKGRLGQAQSALTMAIDLDDWL